MNKKIFIAVLVVSFFLIAVHEYFTYLFLLLLGIFIYVYRNDFKLYFEKRKEKKALAKEEKKKQCLQKFLASEAGQEYVKKLDDISDQLESVEQDLNEVEDHFNNIKNDQA